jgi:hypothetical protein
MSDPAAVIDTDLLAAFDEAAQSLSQDLAGKAQMNFMFGISLVTAKMLIRIDPQAAGTYAGLIGDVAAVLRQQARAQFAALAGTADTPKLAELAEPVLTRHLDDLSQFIEQVEEQYRQELFEPPAESE